jgi:hypothetical protein
MNAQQNANTVGTWKIWDSYRIVTIDQANLGQQQIMNKFETQQARKLMLSLPMWKSISIMLVTFGVVIAVHSSVAVGWMKPNDTVLGLLVCLIMTRNILQVAAEPYLPGSLILTLMRFGSGGPRYTLG